MQETIPRRAVEPSGVSGLRDDAARRASGPAHGTAPLDGLLDERHQGWSDTRRALRLVASFTRGLRKSFWLALVMLIIEAATAVFEAYPLAYLIDYLRGQRPALDLPGISAGQVSTIAVLTIAIVVLAMVNSAADSMAEIFLSRGGRTLGYKLRVTLFGHLQRLSLAFHDQRRTGDVITRVTSDVTELEDFIVESVSDLAGSALLLVGTIAFLLFNSWQVTLVAVLIIPVLAGVTNYFSTRIKSASKRRRAREGELASSTQEMLTSIRVVQTFSRGGREEGRFASQSEGALDAGLEVARLEARFSWLVSVLGAISIAAVVWIGLWLVDRRSITVGILVLFVILVEKMFKPTRRIIKEWNTIGKLHASVERIGDVLDRSVTVRDEPGAVPAPSLEGHVELGDVWFSYEAEPDGAAENEPVGEQQFALRGVSFTISPGEVVALVGHSGAGKSSIAQLLPRLYDPQRGSVLLDGHDVKSFTLESLRAQISVVLQETILFSGSVADNIAYGRPDATREEIVAAAVNANAHEFIEQMPLGYATQLSERASNLSGGQRQRIAIARALIRSTPLLILDEPTTGLDADSTHLVLTGLRTLMKDKTTLLISHDLDLIRCADRILVMGEGTIEESGTHESLLRSGGLYAQLRERRYAVSRPSPNGTGSAASGEDSHPDRLARLLAETQELAAAMRHEATRADRPFAAPGTMSAEDLSAALSPRVLRELPQLPTALDGDAIKYHLQDALLGGRSSHVVESSVPGKAIFVPGEGCGLRYLVQVRDDSGTSRPWVAGARLFGDRSASSHFLTNRIGPLVSYLGRGDEIPFTRAAAVLEGLAMVAYVFPLDADLPTLVVAADPERMRQGFRRILPDLLGEWIDVSTCEVEVAHYPRRHRCLLRYDLRLETRGSTEVRPLTVYGKVASRAPALERRQLEAIGEVLARGPTPCRIPRFLGYDARLNLSLYEGVPGRAHLGELLKARSVEAAVSAVSNGLEEAIDSSAGIIAGFHGCDIYTRTLRTLPDELGAVEDSARAVRRFSPLLGDRLGEWLSSIGAAASEQHSLPMVWSHGDYTHRQILFDGGDPALVDFDTVCRAEPALDLGRFCAYLRVACRRAASSSSTPNARVEDDLCDRFLSRYEQVSTIRYDSEHLRRRVRLYEDVTVLRMLCRSWHQMKPARTSAILAVLEDRLSAPDGLR